MGHQKRLLLAIKRAKDLKSGRRIAQYPTSAAAAACAQAAAAATSTANHHPVAPKNMSHHSVAPKNNIVRPSPPPASNYGSIGSGGMNSFQSLPPAAPAAQRTPTKMDNYHHRSLVYQPEVIRIERAPSVTSMVRPPSCSPSPPPPPPPQVCYGII